MEYNLFIEKWDELSDIEKISCYNEYASEYDPDNQIFSFDEEFFNTFFSSPMDAVRACFFGNIESWNDEYIKFNGYGNLESLCTYKAVELANDYIEEIFRHEEIWLQYIEEEEMI